MLSTTRPCIFLAFAILAGEEDVLLWGVENMTTLSTRTAPDVFNRIFR